MSFWGSLGHLEASLGGGAPLSTLPRHTIVSAPPPRANLLGKLRFSGLPAAKVLKGGGREQAEGPQPGRTFIFTRSGSETTTDVSAVS